uniref:Isoleucine--tRNA ligase, mitochondrial n=1 Tax=Bactrocera dorsalis TaxID=27457 RepID=A0A034VJ05_BACDO
MLKVIVNNTYVRQFSIKQATKPPIKYTDTINLPKTKFPNRLNAVKRLELERNLVEGVFSEAYSYQQQHNHDPAFVLHDGPPYANGDLHMGHAVNKILKDITLRQHTVRGQKVNYIPGWDCHGLPIELKATAFFAAAHVQDSKGTGLVHTAPAHGPEDFLVGLENKLPVICFVNEDGVYSSKAPDFLKGKDVLGEGDRLVLENIASDVLHAGKITHSCPIDWRTKEPVIIRASEQWFMNTEKLKEQALEEISKINVYPLVQADASRKALMTQVRKRPYWCISRQRVWGVPIPVFYERETKKVILNRSLINHVCDLIKKEGNADFWWSQSVEELLPPNILESFKLSATDLEKSGDIFDIWFDSGSTWSSVLKDEKVADVYLEGYDQFSGWFQSSLLTSVAARNQAPYKSIFVHGFTVDDKGHKMSKSLGNVISPKDIIKEVGVDALR